MTIYIGIDPGTKCGWAALDDRGERISSGTWDLSLRRHEGGGMRFMRLYRDCGELLHCFDGKQVMVGYEEVRRHRGTDAAHIYGGIVAMVTKLCEEYPIPYVGIPVGTVKKHATGKGNADKIAMVEAAQGRWGDDGYTEDEADALWIASALRYGYGPAEEAE